jgi:2',3'-cyclic-nucleotide 2'-phosphodiesterase (5'-nucleotidase family)
MDTTDAPISSSGIKRRAFIQAAGMASLGFFLPGPSGFAASADACTISVLHTTDLHSHLLPTRAYDGTENVGGLIRAAAQIAKWRNQNPSSILVDCGDVYQGTEAGVRTQGEIMMRCMNQMRYDAWVPGNHEFDWGIEPFRALVAASSMPVLSANALLDGQPSGATTGPLANISPYLLKEVDGFKIGIVGITTPHLTYWFPDEFLDGFEAIDPIEPVRRAIRELQSHGADAIILAGHMGLRRGNFANRTYELIAEFRGEIAAFLGGHTHRHVPGELVDGVQFLQPGYHGIYAGKLDLVFDKNKRTLIQVVPQTELMDAAVPDDPVIASLTASDLAESAATLGTTAGILADELSIQRTKTAPSDVEWLIASAISNALVAHGHPVDAVFHGLLFPDGSIPAGPKTIRDLWKILPYENYIVTADLDRDQLDTILTENFQRDDYRSIMGVACRVTGDKDTLRVEALELSSGKPIESGRRVRVAFNAYDSQSGGQRLTHLREVLGKAAVNRQLVRIQTRETLIAYFRDREVVRRADSRVFQSAI